MPLPFNDARWSGLSVGVPARPRPGPALEEVRDDVARAGAAAGHPRRANGFVVDQTFFDQTAGERRLVQRHPDDGGALSRPGRHAARRRHEFRNPDLARTYELIAKHGVEGLYRGRSRTRSSTRSSTRVAPDRRPRLAAGRDDDADLAATARLCASRRTSSTAGSTCTRWDRRRAAARPWARR